MPDVARRCLRFPGPRPAFLTSVLMTALLGGCAAFAPLPEPVIPDDAVASRWHAPLPHGGRLADLRQWWSQFDDPLLSRLVDAAQRASPTVAQAAANLADARAQGTASGAALQPALDATASAGRGRIDLDEPTGTLLSAGLQASWELDLFGAHRAGWRAAQARLQSRQAGWHAARVSVAAEVASNYVQLRMCEARLAQVAQDVQSRQQTSTLTTLAANAGLAAPMADELARAGAAQGRSELIRQQASCELWIKALVALSAQEESALRAQLQSRTARLPSPERITVGAVPADVLAQRPDMQAAERDVAAASAEAAQAQAQRMPRIRLAGTIGLDRLATGGMRTDGTVWQIGPVSITLPLFDGGRRRAAAEAARVRYQAAAILYAARLREAVQEVEGALIRLHSAETRRDAAQAAVDGFTCAYLALQSGYRAGSASLLELEDARRSMIASRLALSETAGEQVMAWIALYRALGGGWRPGDPEGPDGRAPAAAEPARDEACSGERAGPRCAPRVSGW